MPAADTVEGLDWLFKGLSFVNFLVLYLDLTSFSSSSPLQFFSFESFSFLV